VSNKHLNNLTNNQLHRLL